MAKEPHFWIRRGVFLEYSFIFPEHHPKSYYKWNKEKVIVLVGIVLFLILSCVYA